MIAQITRGQDWYTNLVGFVFDVTDTTPHKVLGLDGFKRIKRGDFAVAPVVLCSYVEGKDVDLLDVCKVLGVSDGVEVPAGMNRFDIINGIVFNLMLRKLYPGCTIEPSKAKPDAFNIVGCEPINPTIHHVYGYGDVAYKTPFYPGVQNVN